MHLARFSPFSPVLRLHGRHATPLRIRGILSLGREHYFLVYAREYMRNLSPPDIPLFFTVEYGS